MIARSLVFAVAAFSLAACTSSKQLTLWIDTTAGVPCDIDTIKVTATADQVTTITRAITAADLPLTIALSNDASAANFTLDVVGSNSHTGLDVLRNTGTLSFNSDHTAYVVLEPQCTMQRDTPCPLPELVPADTPAPAVAPRYGCGAVARYAMQPGDATFIDTCSLPTDGVALTGDVTLSGNDEIEIAALDSVLSSAKFRFYGQPIDHVWVDPNGYLAFTATAPDPGGNLASESLDSALTTHVPPPAQSAMVFWDKLLPTPDVTRVCYSLDGEPGIRTLRVTWSAACLSPGCTATKSVNFTAVLYEHTQRIDFTYGTMLDENTDREYGSTATVGIINQGTGCTADTCDAQTGLCKTDGVTPCGYTQVFSEAAQCNTQTPPVCGVQNVGFEPVFE